MTLSIVIVNYNVKYFLRQCLQSVYGSSRTLSDGSPLELEVWVVDNDSVDGSVAMVQSDFPQVHLIANHSNSGFARANNQALSQATGDYLLLLNPDTVVQHNTFVECVNHMMQHPECGGLTVKMVDGKGQFLKESKRGFPSPQASFYKMSGLIHLFPHSRRIAAYYMGQLPDNEVNEIEIMPGAFLMLSREAYNQVGGLDESYFMYGEDIDYSWRIHLAGYKNIYLPTTSIIHYKGESTRKGSMNYVYTFYNAMSIFVSRYFSGRNAKLFNLLLKMAIWMRAVLAWMARVAKTVALPLLDFCVAYGGFLLIKHLWATHYVRIIDYYPAPYTFVVIPLYILILMLSSWVSGGYDRPLRTSRIVSGMGIGLLLLLAFYSLLDEEQRYSRMLLLMGSVWTLVSTLLNRMVLAMMGVKGYALHARKRAGILVVGSADEAKRVEGIYSNLGYSNIIPTSDYDIHHLQDLIRIEHAEEVTFCGRDLPLDKIIGIMAGLRTRGVEYKIAPDEGDYIIGANSILSVEDMFTTDLNTIFTDSSRRRKRLFDVGASLLLLLFSPLLIWTQHHKGQYLRHCVQVLWGNLTWVGCTGRRGVFQPYDLLPNATPPMRERLTLRYMRHYTPSDDAAILFRNRHDL